MVLYNKLQNKIFREGMAEKLFLPNLLGVSGLFLQ